MIDICEHKLNAPEHRICAKNYLIYKHLGKDDGSETSDTARNPLLTQSDLELVKQSLKHSHFKDFQCVAYILEHSLKQIFKCF